MIRSILAAVLSFAMSATAPATPVHADAKDVAKIVGGLAAIYAVSRLIEDQRRQGQVRRTEQITRAPVYQPRYEPQPQPTRIRETPRTSPIYWSDRPAPRPFYNPVTLRVLPEQCLRQFDTPDGLTTGYGAQCMQNAVVLPGSLPPNCLRRLNTSVGERTIYAPRCMGRNGWSTRTARR
ncbi:MAG: hypothetical protein AAF919_14515 [Pseudomonadota bacterium]